MVNLIYDFVRNVFIGDTTIEGADNLAVLITWSIIILIFIALCALVRLAFGIGFKRHRRY